MATKATAMKAIRTAKAIFFISFSPEWLRVETKVAVSEPKNSGTCITSFRVEERRTAPDV
jgi:hypothetical protein